MAKQSRYVDIVAEEIVAVTDRAMLVEIEGEDEDVWLPFSQVENPEQYSKG